MYLTKDFNGKGNKEFDWSKYLPNKNDNSNKTIENASEIVLTIRNMLAENGFNMTIAFSQMMRELLRGIKISSPKIIELGAATGFTSKWLVNEYGGEALLVDSSKESHAAFMQDQKHFKSLNYLLEDIFELELESDFDLSCSFGLVEHFSNKNEVLNVHKKFLKNIGYSIILVPLDTPLSRVFYEVHPELNLGYRELLTKKEFVDVLEESGLEIIRTAVTQNYIYDYVGAICKTIN